MKVRNATEVVDILILISHTKKKGKDGVYNCYNEAFAKTTIRQALVIIGW